jgi:hypothetical protein
VVDEEWQEPPAAGTTTAPPPATARDVTTKTASRGGDVAVAVANSGDLAAADVAKAPAPSERPSAGRQGGGGGGGDEDEWVVAHPYSPTHAEASPRHTDTGGVTEVAGARVYGNIVHSLNSIRTPRVHLPSVWLLGVVVAARLSSLVRLQCEHKRVCST